MQLHLTPNYWCFLDHIEIPFQCQDIGVRNEIFCMLVTPVNFQLLFKMDACLVPYSNGRIRGRVMEDNVVVVSLIRKYVILARERL